MNLKRVGVVLRKELLDAARDRRSIMSMVFSAVLGPVLVGFLFTQIAQRQRSAQDIRIPVIGAENAPQFVDWLKQQSGVEVIPGPADAEAAVRDRKEDVILIIDKDFAKHFNRSSPASVKLVSDGSRQTAFAKVGRVRRLVNGYSNQIGALRLISRGVSPAVSQAVQLEEVEVSNSQQRALMIMGFIPIFILLAAFVGGLQIASDSTAGERERGSLEPLLLNPVRREALVVGKWLAATTFAAASVLFSAVLCSVVVRRIPLHELGARFNFGAQEVVGLLAVALPLALFTTSLQMFVASFARSYKEAQSYLGMLMLVPTLPAALSAVYPLTGQPWLYPIPIAGHFGLASDVLGGKNPSPIWFAVLAASTLVVSVLLVTLIARLFQRERIIFGR